MWLQNWQQALALVAASSFCQGGGDRGWRANLDWFLAPDTVVRVIEGRYGDRKDGKASSSGGPVESEEHYA